MSGVTLFLIFSVNLNASDLTFFSDRIHLKCVFFRDRSGHQCSGDDCSKSGKCKYSVDRETRNSMNIFLYHFVSGLMFDLFYQIIKAGTCRCRYFDKRRMFQECSGKFFPYILFHHLQPLFIYEITFIQHNDTLLDSEKVQNIHVLSCLRHDSLIRRDHQEYQIHSDNSRNHVVDKFFMSRNINDPYTVSIFQIKISKPEVNGDPSSLFFFPPVRVTSGKCFYQCRFPMVNVTCGSYDNVFHNNSPSISAIFLK